MDDQNPTSSPATPPIDPYVLVDQISTDPAIPDEQRVSLLAELGRRLNIPTVVRIGKIAGMPIGMKLKEMEGGFARTKDMRDKHEAAYRVLALREAEAAKTHGVVESSISKQLNEINRRYLEAAQELRDRVIGGTDGERK